MNPNADEFQTLFDDNYTKLFGRPVEGMDVEITVWAVNATTKPQAVAAVEVSKSFDAAATTGQRQIFDPALSEQVTASVVLRDDMRTATSADGPCVITEDETTIIVPSSRNAVCHADGCLDVTTTARGN